MLHGRTSGTYTRGKGLRRTYTYSVAWRPTGQGVGWIASVWHDSELKGTPASELLAGTSVIGPELIALRVERLIEDLDDIQE